MDETHRKARALGMNHVALEVGNIEQALAFYGSIFEFELRGRGPRMAFIDLGDQFLALSEGRKQGADEDRHLGLVVDDKAAVSARLAELGVEQLAGSGVEFRDPWGNRIQIVEYGGVQFTKSPHVLRGMGLAALEKSPEAIRQLREKGMAPE